MNPLLAALFALSIHDLTRRSTSLLEYPRFTAKLSIHDLTRRSTHGAEEAQQKE